MRRYLGTISFLVMVILLVAGCDGTSTLESQRGSSENPLALKQTGTLEVRVHDAPNYDIQEILITVDAVEIHQAVAEEEQEQNQAGNGEESGQEGDPPGQTNLSNGQEPVHGNGNSTNGEGNGGDGPPAGDNDLLLDVENDDVDSGEWMPLSLTGSPTFNLLLYQGGLENKLAVEDLDAGTKYTQIRMTISEVKVVTLDEDTSLTHTYTAKLPSGKLKFIHFFEIIGGGATILKFDIDADRSIVCRGNDMEEDDEEPFIFKPVIKLDVLYDDDGDGVPNKEDPCPNDPANDSDADGTCGDVDNCPNDSNPNQEDGDNDGIGDVCDSCPKDPQNYDPDGDGVCGDADYCPNQGDEGNGVDPNTGCPNPPPSSSDGDGGNT